MNLREVFGDLIGVACLIVIVYAVLFIGAPL
jgi:hypothetical protein